MRREADWVHALAREIPGAKGCFERAAPFLGEPRGARFRAVYAGARRQLGSAAGLVPELSPELVQRGRPHFSGVDWVRAGLSCLALTEAPPSDRQAIVRFLFERGELGEQESMLRTLSLLPDPERYLDVALLGVRTNASRVFEAIACENPYPKAFFDEASFNQMVLKALFWEVSVRRIEGLREHWTPELVRMVEAYRSERLAAGRAIPADVEFVIGGADS
jgi:hypothetical protein